MILRVPDSLMAKPPYRDGTEEEEPHSSTPLATTSAPVRSGSELNGENDAMGQEPSSGWNQSLQRRGVAGGVCVVAISPFAGESAGPPLRWGVPSTGDGRRELFLIVLP